MTDCGPCALRSQCTTGRRHTVTIRPEAHYHALRAARQREDSPGFADEYARRAGIEGTLSQGLRRCGLRCARYLGLAKTHLQHVLTAVALNLVRLAEWLAGTPLAHTRHSAFAVLMAEPTPA